ncbi:MAG TPA: hypothetical protein VGL51_00720 [Solirubrobacteraceae bacterium]
MFTSTNPGADAATWTPTTIDPGNGLVHVSCASTSLCVAVDNAGNVVTSTSPLTGAWKAPAFVDSKTKQLHGVSCAPGSTMCVATDDLGNVISSANATGGVASDWKLANANTTHPLHAISCPSKILCVTGDFWGDIITATNPTAGTSTAWHGVHFSGFSEPISVSCKSSSTTVCVMGDQNYQTGGGQVVTSTNPTGPATAWAANYIDHDPAFSSIAGVSCPSTSLCVGVDGNGDVLTTNQPNNANNAWAQFNVTGHNSFRSISCPSTALCIAGDNAGSVYTFSSTDPSNSFDWGLEPSATDYEGSSGTPMTSVACPSTSLCIVGDLVGNILASTDPASTDQNSSPWYYVDCTSSDCASGNPIQAISCSSASLCVAIDGQGNVITSKTPKTSNTSTPGSWKTTATVPSTPSGISCAPSTTTTLCVIVDGPNAIYSTNPTGAWQSKTIDNGHTLEAVSCPSTSLCVAVDNAGYVLTSTSPKTGAWSLPVHLEYGSLTTVSCRSATFTLCVALDQYTGDAFTSFNPTGGAQSWPMSVLPGNFGSALDDAAVSCATPALCVASDDFGNAVVGRLPVPTIRSFSPASGATGSSVTINGTNFVPGASVKFGSLPSPSVSVVSATQIKATVPNGMPSAGGAISVTTAAGTASTASCSPSPCSPSSFTPTLSVTSFSPTSGPYGTSVTINGKGFATGATVKFNGVAATMVTRVSSTQLKATVPSTATTGKISVTNTAAPVGTVSSLNSYTVT